MTRALVILLALSTPALAGHLTELEGERAVAFGGRTWTWDQLQAKRAEAPARFDANHPTLGWVLSHPDAATARRNISPDRFDRYHPYLGWLLGGLAEGVPVPEMPGKGPGCPPVAPVRPNAKRAVEPRRRRHGAARGLGVGGGEEGGGEPSEGAAPKRVCPDDGVT